MKAWIVNPKYESGFAVVFAETRGKAKALALCTSSCEDANFCDIEVSFYCENPIAECCESCPAKEFCDEAVQKEEKT